MDDQPSIRCIFGMRGSGKTTLARQLVTEQTHVLVYDPFAEHDALPFESQELCCAYLDTRSAEFQKGFRVALTAGTEPEEFCALAWVLGGRLHADGMQLTALLEEADLLGPPGRESKLFKQLVAQGRHVSIALVTCSRRPAEVSRWLTSNAHELCIFRTQEPKDLTYLRAFLPGEIVEQLPTLEYAEVQEGALTLDFVHWTPRSCERRALRVPVHEVRR